jgi:hypothetical protein
MFNDRDIAVIGIGAFASVLCLLLPVPFPWKIGIGFIVLAAAMVAALIRLGRDRLTLEEYLFRRIRFRLRPKLWTFRNRDMPAQPGPWRKSAPPREVRQVQPEPVPAYRPVPVAVAWRMDGVRAERLASLLMIVVGAYFLYWLRTGGAAVLGADLSWLLP